jgi:hypothetical protein
MLSHKTGIPNAITVGLVRTADGVTAPVGTVMGHTVSVVESPWGADQILVNVAGPGATEAQAKFVVNRAFVTSGEGV